MADPTSPAFHDLLAEAAGAVGMEPGYWDIWGRWHETTDEVRRAILTSLGIPCAVESELLQAMQARRAQLAGRLAPAAIARRVNEPLDLELRLPEEQAAGALNIHILTEHGSRHHLTLPLADVQPAGEEAGTILKKVTLPVNLPPGYHEASFQLGDSLTAAARLIISPEKAWLPPFLDRNERRAGLAISLYGVRSANTWGCGDFTALRGIVDWVAGSLGGSFIALNPLCALFNRQPFNISPYLPNSVYFRNFLYLDIDAIPDFEHSKLARSLRAHPHTRAEIESLNSAEFVEYEAVAKLKRKFLRLLFRGFFQHEWIPETPRARELRDWCGREGSLLDRFAVFSALEEYLHRRDPNAWVWQQWPPEFQNPDSEAVRQFHCAHPRTILFHKYVQWLIDGQAEQAQQYALARGMETGLFHDLPLATDRCGFDLWATRPFFVHGCRVGAPPDDFSPKGQDWSFPPPNAEAHSAGGYRLFAESIRKSARHGGALRIDHVMRLFRLYWIPDGMDATNGAYVRDLFEDLLRVLTLESHRLQILIVGEDLGTVEPYMRDALSRFGILSYRLFYFEKDGGGGFKLPAQYPAQALVSSTTHDLPTLAGFWLGRDIQAREAAGLVPPETAAQMRGRRAIEKQRMLDVLHQLNLLPDDYPRQAALIPELTGELHNAIMGFLASTPSLLLAVNQEDLTKETGQQNLPGSTWQYPNWRRKMRFTIEDLAGSRDVENFAAMFRNWLSITGRAAAS